MCCDAMLVYGSCALWQLWDVRTLQLLKTYQTERPINAVDISPLFDHVRHTPLASKNGKHQHLHGLRFVANDWHCDLCSADATALYCCFVLLVCFMSHCIASSCRVLPGLGSAHSIDLATVLPQVVSDAALVVQILGGGQSAVSVGVLCVTVLSLRTALSLSTVLSLSNVLSLSTVQSPSTERCVDATLAVQVVLGGGQDAASVTTTSSRQGKFEAVFYHKVRKPTLVSVLLSVTRCAAWPRVSIAAVQSEHRAHLLRNASCLFRCR